MVTNAGGNGAPAVSRLNSAGWRAVGREKTCREKNSRFFQKCKKREILAKIWIFGTLAVFLDDISMTSLGGVKVR